MDEPRQGRCCRIRTIGASGLLVAVSLAASLPTGCASAPPETRYLKDARRAAAWIETTAVELPTGKSWPPDPSEPTKLSFDLYSGAPGVVLFFLELYWSTGERAWLDSAVAGADTLLTLLPDDLDAMDDGLYTGIAGIGLALLETYRATQEERFRGGVLHCVGVLRLYGMTVGRGIAWDDVTDVISGSAGTGLFLLHADAELGLARARFLAIQAGQRLLEVGVPTGAGDSDAVGMWWPMSLAEADGAAAARIMPNFSHGTAGVAYFLARLHEVTGDPVFLDAAVRGARHLESLAGADGLVHHHTPGGEDLYYLGWCHGPVGTARLFELLHRLTGDERWADRVAGAADALMASGLPEQRTPGTWDNVGMCCGTAGVAQFFLDLDATADRRDPRYRAFALRLTDDVIARATSVPPDGLKWIQAEHRVQPDLLVAQTGTMQGAAGIGLLLLHVDARLRGRRPVITFPDTPFTRDRP